jgi:hypothetical protein
MSCPDILECFSGSNDVVKYYTVTGEIHIEPRDAADDEADWFERAFGCAKFP